MAVFVRNYFPRMQRTNLKYFLSQKMSTVPVFRFDRMEAPLFR